MFAILAIAAQSEPIAQLRCHPLQSRRMTPAADRQGDPRHIGYLEVR
ncbi:MAG: hypothetical protein ACI91B_005156 [Planctomycetota bacterium]